MYPFADEAQNGHTNDGHLQFEEPGPLFPVPSSSAPSSDTFVSHLEDLDTDYDTRSALYGYIPQRVPVNNTLREVDLHQGNFVLETPVPSTLLSKLGISISGDPEFINMRYSAATCDPNDFKSAGFTLRQALYEPPRKTEIFIVITMYNEDERLFARTMHGVMKNITHMCRRRPNKNEPWNMQGWQKVVVCIVSDGRAYVHSKTLSVLAAMGCYQHGIAKDMIGNKMVTAHIYEYTTAVTITSSLTIEPSEKGKDTIPVQVIFCLKEKNQKKINSHRWFFNAFGPILKPEVCILLDVGTMPGPTALYQFWRVFHKNRRVGGACGEIVAQKGEYCSNLLNPLVAAQNFEYKMSNILDKPLESVFGYITVLPGAFSAYRYVAVQNDAPGRGGPLHRYFLGETRETAGGTFSANMYLAEDRILSWEVVSKRGCSWTLRYVKSAYAVTDVPDQLPELMSQRRRWLNGSFFAGVHSAFHFFYIYRSSHSFLRKFFLHFEMLYILANLVFSWFSLANYYIAFYTLSTSIEDPIYKFRGIHLINLVLNYFYLGLLITCFILALGNRPQGAKLGYTLSVIGFAVITIYMTMATALLSYKDVSQILQDHKGKWTFSDFIHDEIFRNTIASIVATIGLYIVSSLLFLDPWHLFTSIVQYWLMAPSFTNVLNVYAFANVHDISWGTKGDNASTLGAVTFKSGQGLAKFPSDPNEQYENALTFLQSKIPLPKKPDATRMQRKDDYYRNFRTNVLLAWVISNSLLAGLITGTNPSALVKGAGVSLGGYMRFLLYSIFIFAFIRFCGAVSYVLHMFLTLNL